MSHEASIAVAAELTFARHGAELGIQFLADEIAKVRAMGLDDRRALRLGAVLVLSSSRRGVSTGRNRCGQDERLPSGRFGPDRSRPSVVARDGSGVLRAHPAADRARRPRRRSRDLANRLRTIASEHGLKRTLMRALALSMTIDADTDRAVEPLVEFLRLMRRHGLPAATGPPS